ncbi:phosphoglycerate dehydrogenase [bacterium]|nr:phosphoglycerate dehydrogenase [bacterium]MDC1038047.1 phosphoglycerate dehydrogenase [Candidatus Neomarinimicrobiota bacterium]
MKILVSDSITDAGLSILKDSGLDIVYLPDGTPEEKQNAAKDVHGWIIRSGTKITAEMIHTAENLQVIGRAGVGVDNIDFPSATRKGIVVMNTPDVNTISAAEHTVGLMLTLSRNIHQGHSGIEKGEWNRHKLVGTELRYKTLGIVGLGKIGREVMDRCRSFGMNMIGFDPYVSQDMFREDEIKIVDLDTLTKTADFISVHVPLNDHTRDLFNFERLCQMKPTARIINVARGGIINETDLAKAVKEEKIAGAAIDVFTSEPIDISHPLVGIPNIVLSPHLGASTKEAKEGVSRAICEQVRDCLLHDKLSSALNMPISDMAKLKEIQPFLQLAELLGHLQSQIAEGPISHVSIDCQGAADEIKPISLACLKGLLQSHVPERINYINAETIAKELGVELDLHYSTAESSYTNLISTKVTISGKVYRLDGSVFEDNRPRLVNILHREMEVTPRGTMLLVENNDVPGVIGNVGTFLGGLNVNIAAYLLNRSGGKGSAFAVIRLDNSLSKETLKVLGEIDDIQSINQIQALN